MQRAARLMCLLVFASVPTLAAPTKPAPKPTLLSSSWTGRSLCVDLKRTPACKDETIVYRFVPAGPHAVTLYADKIIAGKRDPMGALRMHLGDGDRSATAHFTWGNGTGTWDYRMTSDSTLHGTLHEDTSDALTRNVDAHAIAERDLPSAPTFADYGEPH